MSNSFFISDLHLGHKNVLKWAGDYRDGETIDEHDTILIDKINSRVGKRDKLFILGDVVWYNTPLEILDRINGNKELIIGNHDERHVSEYLKYFSNVHGFKKYQGYWLSHCPIHPSELRGRKNIHGHVHQNNDTNSDDYICVCVEPLNGYPISLDEIVEKYGRGNPDRNFSL